MSDSNNSVRTKPVSGQSAPTNDPICIEEKVDRLKLDELTSSMHYRLPETMSHIIPPRFTRITLLYPEDEIWTRLQIREFLYHFGSVCQLEPRLITSLHNVQDNWRIRRLSAAILWQALIMIGDYAKGNKKTASSTTSNGTTGNNNTSTSSSNNNTNNISSNYNTTSQIKSSVQTQARRTVNAWGSELGVTKQSATAPTKAQLDRIGELLAMKGMTAHRWQDVAELLAMADFRNLPVPTFTSTTETDSDEDTDEDEEMDGSDDSEDSDSDDDIDLEIKKFRALGRSPLTAKEELMMVRMLLDLLLLDGQLRRHMSETAKDARMLEDELRQVKKATEAETIRYHSTRHQLEGRIEQLVRFGGDASSLHQDLEDLNTTYQQRQAELYEQAMHLSSSLSRSSNRRPHYLVTPWDGNEYWLFNDLFTPQQHKDGTAMADTYWGHGVIAIGRSPEQQQEKETTKRKWWHISGISNIQTFDKWLTSHYYMYQQEGALDTTAWASLETQIIEFRNHLVHRMDYLWLLEQTVDNADYS
ncbi:hypothetical protein [Absidia glauca]|uniref:Uncharacterized protein n=1 Tax=Absidia glauca TaxID=4829 RepID=A0A163J5Z5_ABSGL|nr:hypothetical protein [Absidia glauca]